MYTEDARAAVVRVVKEDVVVRTAAQHLARTPAEVALVTQENRVQVIHIGMVSRIILRGFNYNFNIIMKLNLTHNDTVAIQPVC